MPQGSIPLPDIIDEDANWDPAVFRRLLEYLREQELLTYNVMKDVMITGAPDKAGRRPRLILRADDGTYWSVKVNNLGLGVGELEVEEVDPLTLPRAGISLA